MQDKFSRRESVNQLRGSRLDRGDLLTNPSCSTAHAARALRLSNLVAVFIAVLLLAGIVKGAQQAQSPKPKTIELQPAQLDGLVGQYRYSDEPDIVISFWRDGSRFYLESERRPPLELFADSENHFLGKSGHPDYTF